MNLWILEAAICAGLVLMAFALFGSSRPLFRKLGAFVLVGATGAALWFCTKNWVIAIAGMSVWFVLPILQATWMSRRLHFSSKRKLEPSQFDMEEFPEINGLTGELKKEGFRMDQDYWLRPSPVDQGYRVLVNEEEDVYAAISIVRYGNAALVYLLFATPAQGGAVWLTWDYPLAYGLMMPPHFMVHRCTEAETPAELHEQHREFLSINKVKPKTIGAQNPAKFFEELFSSTIQHNLREGVLSARKSEEINYTWRGTAFVLWQVLREVVKG